MIQPEDCVLPECGVLCLQAVNMVARHSACICRVPVRVQVAKHSAANDTHTVRVSIGTIGRRGL